MQPPDYSIVDPALALELVFHELRRHAATSRKNFPIRVSVDLVEYLFSAMLRTSGMSKVALERSLTELGVYGFKDADGRILRRYLSGQTRMGWDTYRRLLLWALSHQWISDWAFRDLLFRTYLREAAQLSARKIINTQKRRVAEMELTREQIVDCFNKTYLRKELERVQAAMSRFRVDSDARAFASQLGFESEFEGWGLCQLGR